MIGSMDQRQLLARQATLLGQALLIADPRRLAPPDNPGDSDTPFAAFCDEILLAQGAPEPAEIEYTRLFLSPDGAPCSPWQSTYDPEPRLMGPAHHAALDWFRRYGAEPSASNEPADHLGLLLLFFAQLLTNEEDTETLKQFRAQHLDWSVTLLEKMKTEARHPLHLSLARAALHLLTTLAREP
jgi:TorA maturation chaperone TorD